MGYLSIGTKSETNERRNKIMRISIKKTIALVLILLNVLTLLFGCNMSDKERFIKKIKRSFGGGDSIEITAEPFAQQIPFSAVFSLEIKIVEDNIYIEDSLYDKIDYIDSREILFDDTIFFCVSKETTDEEYSKIIEKIKSAKKCYMLDNDDTQPSSRNVAVYIIDGTYYFLTIDVNEVLRIHYAHIE